MTKENPNYYAVIPADVRYSDISPNAKLLYGEITALANKEGYCWASNDYFAKLYKVTKTSVSLWIRQLRDNGFIEYEVQDNYKRRIYLKGVLRNVKGGIKKIKRGVLKKVKHNITSNNTNNTISIAKQSFAGDEINEMIEMFKDVNPSYERLFGNKTQRKAMGRLLKKYGRPAVEKMIKGLKGIFGQPYAPTITDPYLLEKKLPNYISYLEKKSKEKIQFIDFTKLK